MNERPTLPFDHSNQTLYVPKNRIDVVFLQLDFHGVRHTEIPIDIFLEFADMLRSWQSKKKHWQENSVDEVIQERSKGFQDAKKEVNEFALEKVQHRVASTLRHFLVRLNPSIDRPDTADECCKEVEALVEDLMTMAQLIARLEKQ